MASLIITSICWSERLGEYNFRWDGKSINLHVISGRAAEAKLKRLKATDFSSPPFYSNASLFDVFFCHINWTVREKSQPMQIKCTHSKKKTQKKPKTFWSLACRLQVAAANFVTLIWTFERKKRKKKKEGWGRDKETNWDLNVYEKWPDVNNDQKKEPVDAEVKAKEKRKKGSKNILLFNLINTEAR